MAVTSIKPRTYHRLTLGQALFSDLHRYYGSFSLHKHPVRYSSWLLSPLYRCRNWGTSRKVTCSRSQLGKRTAEPGDEPRQSHFRAHTKQLHYGAFHKSRPNDGLTTHSVRACAEHVPHPLYLQHDPKGRRLLL